MTQKWNLQDIRPAEPRRRRPTQSEMSQVAEVRQSAELRLDGQKPSPDYDTDTIVIKNGPKQSKRSVIILSLVAVMIVVGVFGLSFALSKTTLTVYPEFSEPTVNAEFIAYPEMRDGQLSYEIMTLTEDGERQVKATGQETVKEQAKGFIEIIKSTPGTERLIKNTRFRSADGLIFRIQESVVVPGAIKDTTGKLVPGTIRAEVFAENPGVEYNLPVETRFDVPGFKESNLNELYNAIYAVNREAFTGGFNGPRFIIDENELATSKQALQIELRDKLLARVSQESPAGFVGFPGSIAISYTSQPTIQFGDNLVTIREQATLQLPLFKHSDFASFLAKETVPTYSQQLVRITNISELTFAYKDSNTSTQVIANLPSLTFSVLGKPQIVSEFDVEQLKKDLAGKAHTALAQVLGAHTGISRAQVSGKPFWKRSFPESSQDIEIIEVIGEEK
jgi:hypothetical protein